MTVLSLRVRQLVSDRAAGLRRAGHAPRPKDGVVGCIQCGTAAQLGTPEVCCWWPFGCTTSPVDPYPRLCWDCCGEDERADLVDAGCIPAAMRQRGWWS